MFTSENDSRLVNTNAICEDETEASGERVSGRSVRSVRQIDTPCEGGGCSQQTAVENVSDGDECAEEKRARRSRTQHFLHRRSTSCSTVSLSPSYSKSAKRKRKKKHKHHHRHRSNRANDSYQQSSSPTPTPKVNPIFVWIKQDDTKIVQVLCEDYDRRNRIRLTKTPNGWRSIPLTESLEKRWPLAGSENVQNNELVKTDNLPVVIKSDNPLENKQQTDNFNDLDKPSTSPQSTPDVECSISSTCVENGNDYSPPAFPQKSPVSEETATKVPFVDNGDPFDSDESTQDDLRSIINKVQTDSLYSDDEQVNESHRRDYVHDFCPVNSTCEDDNDTNNKANQNANTIQCDEVTGNEVHFSESDTNSESQTGAGNDTESRSGSIVNQNREHKENDQKNSTTISCNVESAKRVDNETDSPLNENTFRSVTSQDENIEFASRRLSPKDEILPFNNKQKAYHDSTPIYENEAECFDVRDNNVESSSISTEINPDNVLPSETRDEISNRQSPEQIVTQSRTEYVLEKPDSLKCEPNRAENEVTEFRQNVTVIDDDPVNSSSKYEFTPSRVSSPIVSIIKTEKVDTHEVIDDHVDDYDLRKDGNLEHIEKADDYESKKFAKTPEHPEKANDPHRKSSSVVLRTPLCQTLKIAKTSCRKMAKKSRNLDELKTEPLPAHMQTVISQPALEISGDVSYSSPTFSHSSVQNEPLDLGVCRLKHTEPNKNPVVAVETAAVAVENRDRCRKRVRPDDKSEKENDDKRIKKSRLLDLLTSKNVSSESPITISDPLEQLKDVLANPKYSVPDPLLVPKARLSALVSSPGKEIPRLLARKAQDLSYFSILSDPDVLVVSLSHLQSLIKKPINEEEIQKYQKKTEDLRVRLRQECFNNNYENMATGNWNQCCWIPSFQKSGLMPYEPVPPDMLSMLNYIPSSTSCCADLTPPANGADYQKQMQFQKDAAMWQEFALQQLSVNPSYDPFNNNNCDLAKDGCAGVLWNQDVCSNYRCYQPSRTPPIKSNYLTGKKYVPGEPPVRKIGQSLLPPTMPCNGNTHLDYHLIPPCDAELFLNSSENHFLPHEIENEKCNRANESKLRDRYDSLRQLLQNSSENADLLQHFETQMHSYADEERKIFKDERTDNRVHNGRNNTNTKESKDTESAKSSRPVVPKIKVRKHLVDPNQRPKLLNIDSHPLHNAVFPNVDYATSHLWNPFFGSNMDKNYKKLQWTTPATSKAD